MKFPVAAKINVYLQPPSAHTIKKKSKYNKKKNNTNLQKRAKKTIQRSFSN